MGTAQRLSTPNHATQDEGQTCISGLWDVTPTQPQILAENTGIVTELYP
jgi:hypothetical protein